MNKKRNFTRNVAIFGVFAVLTGLAGTASWLSATQPAGKPVHSAAVPQLPREFDVVDTATGAIEVEYLNAKVETGKGVKLSYPETPASLAKAAKAWVDERVEEFDGAGELKVSFDPFLAAGHYLAVELRATTTDKGERTLKEQTIVTEVGSDNAWFIQELVSEETRHVWATHLRRAVKSGALDIDHPSGAEALEMVEEGLPRAHLTPEGVHLPVPGTETSLVIHDAFPSMTKDGVKVGEAAAARETFVGLPAPTLIETEEKTTITFPGEGGVDCQQEKCIALTFDDGPEPGTERLLDILAQKKVRSTFFLIGSQVPGHAGTVQRMVKDGHIVGNHTWMHPQLPKQSRKEVRSQIDRTTRAIVEAGAPRPTLFRPPYGALSDMVRGEVSALGYATILWDVDTLDWETRDTKKTVKNALADARPGGIILMHDIHQETIDAVPTIIDELRKDGFTLVTVPELLGGEARVGGVYLNNR